MHLLLKVREKREMLNQWSDLCTAWWFGFKQELALRKRLKEFRQTGGFLRKLRHGTCKKYPQIQERGCWQKELGKWRALGPWATGQHLPQVIFSRFPQLQPSPAFRHSLSFLSTALLSSPNLSFTLPPPFLGPWKSKVLSTWVSGLSHHLLSLGKLWRIWPSWPCDPGQCICGTTPVSGHEESSPTTTYSTGLCAKQFIHIISLSLQTTLGE